MDAGMRYYLHKDMKELQFKVETLKEDNQVLNKRINEVMGKVTNLVNKITAIIACMFADFCGSVYNTIWLHGHMYLDLGSQNQNKYIYFLIFLTCYSLHIYPLFIW